VGKLVDSAVNDFVSGRTSRKGAKTLRTQRRKKREENVINSYKKTTVYFRHHNLLPQNTSALKHIIDNFRICQAKNRGFCEYLCFEK